MKLHKLSLIYVGCLVVVKCSSVDSGEDNAHKFHSDLDEGSVERTKRFTGSDENELTEDDGNIDDGLDKRFVGRWRNYQYQTGRGNKRNIGILHNPDYWMVDQLFARPESRDKRHVGRWKNWNWMVSRAMPTTGDNSHIDEKRFLGRWKNWNYLMSQRKADDLDKRFVGRWLQRNYLLSNGLDSDEEDVDKRFVGRWKNRNYQTGK